MMMIINVNTIARNYSVHNPKGVGAISNRPQCVIRLMVDGEYHSCEYQLSDSHGQLVIARNV